MATNDFLPFCPTDTGTNLLSEGDYAAAANRTIGNQPGVASSKLNNKAIRQGTYVVSQLAQMVSDTTNSNVLDDAIPAKLLAQMNSALGRIAPVITKYLSGTATNNLTFAFGIVAGSASTGATYTNNGNTFTVSSTVSSGVMLQAFSTGNPTASGTLTKATGTGDATITFYCYRVATYIRAKLVGGGAGGTGSGSSGSPGTGTAGGDTTISVLTAGGGQVGVARDSGGPGGTATVAAGFGFGVSGGQGSGASGGNNAGSLDPGGDGGDSPYFGGGGCNGSGNDAGSDGNANTGGGGQGGGNGGGTPLNISGAGGGSGAYVEGTLHTGFYTYAVGAGGTGGSPGASGFTGGAGADGVLILEEYFQ